ncbi:MAG: hypothetical protein R2932_06035 [Caldilineaceae bacterium]
MVITTAKAQLLVAIIDACTNGSWGAKIKGVLRTSTNSPVGISAAETGV